MADALGLFLNEMAVFAPTQPAIKHLRTVIGRRWPDLDPHQELFRVELCGVPMSAVRHHTLVPHDDVPFRLTPIVNDYLLLIARANQLSPETCSAADAHWLMGQKPMLLEAMRTDLEARLRQVPLPEDAALHAIAAHVAAHKRKHRLLDRADLVHGEHRVSPQVRLLLLDEVEAADEALLTPLFPNASIVITSRLPGEADLRVHLPRTLRTPERIDIADRDPDPSLVPPLPDFKSLFILAPSWRTGKWFTWLRDRGLPPPYWGHWRAIRAAWRLDQDLACSARHIRPLLQAAGLEPGEDPVIEPGDIAGWTSWHELASRFDARLCDHADAVLARYGTLLDLPTVHLGQPPSARLREADIVIWDDAGWPEIRALAESRATSLLIRLRRRP